MDVEQTHAITSNENSSNVTRPMGLFSTPKLQYETPRHRPNSVASQQAFLELSQRRHLTTRLKRGLPDVLRHSCLNAVGRRGDGVLLCSGKMNSILTTPIFSFLAVAISAIGEDAVVIRAFNISTSPQHASWHKSSRALALLLCYCITREAHITSPCTINCSVHLNGTTRKSTCKWQ